MTTVTVTGLPRTPGGNNTLYLVILPLIHLNSGLTEETLTLLPDRNFATEFFEDEVERFIVMFKDRTKYLTGGDVIDFKVDPEQIGNNPGIVCGVKNVS